MAGPNIDVILGLSNDADRIATSRKIFRIAASTGLGLIFGTDLVRRLYVAEGQMLEDLSNEVKNPLVFTVTSNPMATDALELFKPHLNRSESADQSNSTLLDFFDAVYTVPDVCDLLIVIWDGMVPSAQFMPRHDLTKIGFKNWLADYHRLDLADPAHGGQGIFRVLNLADRLTS